MCCLGRRKWRRRASDLLLLSPQYSLTDVRICTWVPTVQLLLSSPKNSNLDMKTFWNDVHHPNTKWDTLYSCPIPPPFPLPLPLPLPFPLPLSHPCLGGSGLVFVYLGLLRQNFTIYPSWPQFHSPPASIS
ncbi:rCG56123 [Rattus norvegicus]|uniref:RCG56123 n=1 Tax=Rattus norvegicus TaxID=10116 RepID=A6IA58_RAT|nr:rCG56123 [Rattus norvegicus]